MLIKRRRGDAVRVSLHDQRPIRDRRQDASGHFDVVTKESPLVSFCFGQNIL